MDVKEEGFIAVNDEVIIGIKLEEIPEDFPDIKSEADEVSYVCVCYFWPLKTATMLGMKVFCCNFFCGVCWCVCTRRVGLQVIVEKMKSYSYVHVAKTPYPQDIS